MGFIERAKRESALPRRSVQGSRGGTEHPLLSQLKREKDQLRGDTNSILHLDSCSASTSRDLDTSTLARDSKMETRMSIDQASFAPRFGVGDFVLNPMIECARGFELSDSCFCSSLLLFTLHFRVFLLLADMEELVRSIFSLPPWSITHLSSPSPTA